MHMWLVYCITNELRTGVMFVEQVAGMCETWWLFGIVG